MIHPFHAEPLDFGAGPSRLASTILALALSSGVNVGSAVFVAGDVMGFAIVAVIENSGQFSAVSDDAGEAMLLFFVQVEWFARPLFPSVLRPKICRIQLGKFGL